MLGTISRDHVERLAELLASMNVQELMQCARSLEEFAPDYAQVLDELAGLLVRVAMKQTVSDFEGDDLYAPELLERLAKALSPEDIQLYYQTAITGRRDLALAPDPRTGFEMTLLRMIAFRPASDSGVAQVAGSANGGTTVRNATAGQAAQPGSPGGAAAARSAAQAGASGGAAAAARAAAQAGANGGAAVRAGARQSPGDGVGASTQWSGAGQHASAESAGTRQSSGDSVGASGQWARAGGSGQQGGTSDAERRGQGAAGAGQGTPAGAPDASWSSILNQLDLQGAARQLASHCALVGRQGGLVRLALDPRAKFVRTPSQEEKLAQALSGYYGETVRIEISAATSEVETPAQVEQRASQQELETARQAFETDPGVQGLRERFGATLLPDTVRPVK